MLRHPDKRANIKALTAHFHLIEETGHDDEEGENEDPANTTATTAATTDDDEDAAAAGYDDDEDEDEEDMMDANSMGFGLSQSHSSIENELSSRQYHYQQQQQQQPMYQDNGGQRYGMESHYR